MGIRVLGTGIARLWGCDCCCSRSAEQKVYDDKTRQQSELSREVGLAWFRGSRAVSVRGAPARNMGRRR